MEVFVLAWRVGELSLKLCAGRGPSDRGQRRLLDGLLLLSTEILRSPGSVCQEQVVTQAVTVAAIPPTATARRQRGQSEERCLLAYCQWDSEIPHMLKTLPIVQRRLFNSRALLFLCRNDWEPLALEVVSRLQHVEDVIRCKCSVEWGNHPWHIFMLHISEGKFLLSLARITKPMISVMTDLHCVPVLTLWLNSRYEHTP